MRHLNIHSGNLFTKPKLIAFILIFAIIGSILLLRSYASNPTLPGDENNDGTVNVLDLSILLSNWNSMSPQYDVNGDNVVNILDLSILLSHWGQTTASAPTITITANPTLITAGQSSVITWSAINAASCSAGWTASTSLSGTQNVSPAATTDYAITCTGPGGNATATATVTVQTSSLSIAVSGNRLVNGSGTPLQLIGVNVTAGSNCIPIGNMPYGVVYPLTQVSTAETITGLKNWHINAIRLTMNEDCWLGINGIGATYSGANYQNAIISFVNTVVSNGIYVDIDMHESGPGTYVANSPQLMADADHATAYWQSVASTFKSYPAVLFEAYNEPHITFSNTTDANSWDCWLNGCTATETDQNGNQPVNGAPNWTTAGMQSLVDAIRSTGAVNPILLGGLNWSQDLSSFLNYLPNDPNHQLVAAYHNYMSSGSRNTQNYWDTVIAPIAAQMPVFTSEMGEKDGGSNYVTQYMTWADTKGISYTPWLWATTSAGGTLGLLSSWDGTPSVYGQTFYGHFHQLNP